MMFSMVSSSSEVVMFVRSFSQIHGSQERMNWQVVFVTMVYSEPQPMLFD